MINKYTIAGVGFLIVLLFTAYNSARIATKICEGKHKQEIINSQETTIKSLDNNVKTIIKSKKIAEDNHSLDRDQLINKL